MQYTLSYWSAYPSEANGAQLTVVKIFIGLKCNISFLNITCILTAQSSNLCLSWHSYSPMCHLVEKVNLKRYCQPELGGFTMENEIQKNTKEKGSFLFWRATHCQMQIYYK